MNILKELTGSQARANLLIFFAKHDHREVQFTELQKESSINPRQLTLQLQKLVAVHCLIERKEGNRKYYRANTKVGYFKALQQLVGALTEEELLRWERAGTVHHLAIVAEAAMKPMKRYFGVSWPTVLMIFTGENVLWCCKDGAVVAAGEKIIEWYEQEKHRAQYEFDVRAHTTALQKILDEIGKTNLKKITGAQLLKLYEKAYRIYTEWYAILWAAEPVSRASETFLNDKLSDISSEEMASLTAPTKKSFSQEIEDDLNALVTFVRKKHEKFDLPEVQRAVTAFQCDYFWMYNNYFETKILQNEEIILEVKKRLKKNNPPKNEVENLAKEKEKLMNRLGLDHETRNIINISDEFIYWQDLRKKWIMKFAHYLELLLSEAGRRAGLSIHAMRATMPAEFAQVLAGKNLSLPERQKNCLVVIRPEDERGAIFVGQTAKNEEKKYFSAAAEPVEQEVLRGTVACGGKAIGTARVLMNPTEAYRVKHGDILVTSMTSPDFMQAVRKCAGIVTNEGGITCHAAVIARELNIPCVIGTKTATMTLKDGDIVEVDADRGIISIVR